MGAQPVVETDDSQDELAAALAASKDPGKAEPEPEPVEEEKPADEPKSKSDDSTKGEESKADEKKDEEDTLFDPAEHNRELRQLLRQQRREMSILQAKLSRIEKRSVEANKKVEEADTDEETLFGRKENVADKPAEPADDLSPIEAIQSNLASLASVKGPILETLLETMEMNPKYEDVRAVCSQANFDDIFEAIGDSVAAKEGKDSTIAALEAEFAVWKMANPYKYMYDLIKKYHPKYAGRQPAAKGAAKAGDTKPKEPAKAPTSLASVPGKSASAGAWTAARIDELPEDELDQVPADVYDKYLRGALD
jgi:hypothetical protein